MKSYLTTLALVVLLGSGAQAQQNEVDAIYNEMVTNLKIDTVNIHDTQRLIQAALLEPDLCFHGNPHPSAMGVMFGDDQSENMRTPIKKLRKQLATYEAEYTRDKKHYRKLIQGAIARQKRAASSGTPDKL